MTALIFAFTHHDTLDAGGRTFTLADYECEGEFDVTTDGPDGEDWTLSGLWVSGVRLTGQGKVMTAQLVLTPAHPLYEAIKATAEAKVLDEVGAAIARGDIGPAADRDTADEARYEREREGVE